MVVVFLLFVYSVVNRNAFGLSFYHQNTSRENIEQTVVEGTNILQNAIKNNLLTVERTLQNTKSLYIQNHDNMALIMKDVQIALDSCENSLFILERIHFQIHPDSINLKACSILPILEQAIDQSQAEHADKNVQIIKDIGSNPQLICDPVHIREVILNLINNGMEAVSGDGKGILVITVTHNKNKVKIQIRDNGCGIDKNHTKRLGIPFFTSKKEGTHNGLGLYYVKKIINMHNGQFALKKFQAGGILAEIILPIVNDK
jgi:signal transduction histidine kinase